MRDRRTRRRVVGVRFALIVFVAVCLTTFLALSQRRAVARCPEGLPESGWRCCPYGQNQQGGACVGTATACASTQMLVAGACLPADTTPKLITGGELRITPSDWEAEGELQELQLRVKSFRLSPTETTYAQWQECARDGLCRRLPKQEPGLPVTGISAQEAAAYCESVGGRLPTAEEWIFAAAGESGRRYPWGQTGLVCRRAVYGLVAGPCARSGDAPQTSDQTNAGPELVGSRPSGATPEGLLDMAGNVAEWTLALPPADGFQARGGSFRSELAGELKTWAALSNAEASDSTGIRCAFDASE